MDTQIRLFKKYTAEIVMTQIVEKQAFIPKKANDFIYMDLPTQKPRLLIVIAFSIVIQHLCTVTRERHT
jgi:hypothetical protein